MANGTLAASQIEMLTQSGTGIVTIVPPATNTNRTLTLPDSTGTLLNTNGGTITGNLTVSGITTLGNGAVLGVPASGTVTNLTGTASININGTVGATTPTTVAATTVIATGGISGHAGSRVVMDYAAGTGRIWGYGVNDATIGEVSIQLRSSAGSLGATAATFSSAGLAVTGALSATDAITTGTDVKVADGGYVYSPTGSASGAVKAGIQLNGSGSITSKISDVTVTNVSSTGFAVTGTLSATGITTLSAANTALLLSGAGSSSTTLASNYAIRINASVTAANYGGIFFDGSTSYDSFFGRVPTALSGINDGIGYVTYSGGAPTLRTLFSSTGLAVTGTLSASSNAGIGRVVSASAGLIVRGLGTTSATRGLVVENSSGTELLVQTDEGNLGIGTTSPNIAGVARALTVNGSDAILEVANGGTLRASVYGNANGAAFSGVGSSGIRFFTSASSATTLAATIDTAQNMGLGVAPSAWSLGKAIEVGSLGNGILGWGANDISVSSGGYYNAGWKWSATNSLGASHYEQYSGASYWFVAAPVSHTAGDAISFTQAMTLDASGNLAIGTTTVNNANSDVLTIGKNSASYDVAAVIRQFANGTAANLQLIAANDAGAAYNFISSSTQGGTQHWRLGGVGGFTGGLAFSTSGSERGRIDSGGNLGIGTTSPSQRLHVANSAADPYILVGGNSRDCGLLLNASTQFTALRADAANRLFVSSGTGEIVFTANGSERARIDTSGNFLIGTTTSTSKLVVATPTAGTNTITLVGGLASNFTGDSAINFQGYNSSGGFGSSGTILVTQDASGSTSAGRMVFSTSAAGGGGEVERARIDSSGNLLVGATSTTGAVANYKYVLGGRFTSLKGDLTSLTSGVAYTMFTMIADFTTYLVTVSGLVSDASYSETAIVHLNNTTVSVTIIAAGSNIVISNSGLAVQVTQNGGVTMADLIWSAMRIA